MGKQGHKGLGKRKAAGGAGSVSCAGGAGRAALTHAQAAKKARPSKPAKGGKAAAAEAAERGPTGKPKRKADQPKKVKLRDQKVIPVPRTAFAGGADDSDGDSGSDSDLDDLGAEDGLEAGAAGGFLASLDPRALSR